MNKIFWAELTKLKETEISLEMIFFFTFFKNLDAFEQNFQNF